MTAHDPRDEDGGYGAANLVGSNESGLRSAIEARQAIDASRARDASARPHGGNPRVGGPGADDGDGATSAGRNAATRRSGDGSDSSPRGNEGGSQR